ncbi:MAG: OmpA family protein [Sulfurovaceae bacterium]|nr:OmpA family protein [Sulfurovaceae bacterium]
MKKSNKILLYGLLVSILYIVFCIYIHKDSMIVKLKTMSEDKVQNVSLEGSVDGNSDININRNKSKLDYKIDNGVITIAGNMPILDDNDSLKKTMLRFCGEEYCDRTIIFSEDIAEPSWKNLAKEFIDLFYEENLTNASFLADEFGNIFVGGELLTNRAKDKINAIIKSNNGVHITDNTHLKVLTLPKETSTISEVTTDINNSIDKNIVVGDSNIDAVDIAQNRIIELLETKKINFVRNHARITRRGIQTLKEVISIIKDIPNIKIIVKGYTDAGGKRSINKWISQERAKSVKKYLGTHGINPKDIEAKGFGEDDLLYEDKPFSPLNRRVEIEIKRR